MWSSSPSKQVRPAAFCPGRPPCWATTLLGEASSAVPFIQTGWERQPRPAPGPRSPADARLPPAEGIPPPGLGGLVCLHLHRKGGTWVTEARQVSAANRTVVFEDRISFVSGERPVSGALLPHLPPPRPDLARAPCRTRQQLPGLPGRGALGAGLERQASRPGSPPRPPPPPPGRCLPACLTHARPSTELAAAAPRRWRRCSLRASS
jgi:hypothetical protein